MTTTNLLDFQNLNLKRDVYLIVKPERPFLSPNRVVWANHLIDIVSETGQEKQVMYIQKTVYFSRTHLLCESIPVMNTIAQAAPVNRFARWFVQLLRENRCVRVV